MGVLVEKRDGRTEELNEDKIAGAIRKCLGDEALGASYADERLVRGVTSLVMNKIQQNGSVIHVENIQDKVETALMEMGLYEEAKQFILFRNKKSEEREDTLISTQERLTVENGLKTFGTELQKFVYYRTYSKFIPEMGRRETWAETVDRVIGCYRNHAPQISETDWTDLRQALISMDVLPSMRGVGMAGDALERDNSCLYNCSAHNLDSIDAFSEQLYLLMAGCGVGFSVELYNSVDKLPRIRKQRPSSKETMVIEDSAEGWAEALKAGMTAWFNGKDIDFDYRNIRPAGARLRTKGGYACLVGDTVIFRSSSDRKGKTIEEIYENWNGTPVKAESVDPATGEIVRNKIVGVSDQGVQETYCVVTFGERIIQATSNHRFLNRDRKWAELSEFKIGDYIGAISYRNKTERFVFDRISDIAPSGKMRVYDVGMEGPHHNFIADGFVSHNSGPDPLRKLLTYCKNLILSKQGQKLEPIDVHDIGCMIGEVVVAGGVRRSACISLSDLDDEKMRHAKEGSYWQKHACRAMANNSAVYEEKPNPIEFMEEWLSLAKSGTGERGMFNRQAALKSKPKRRKAAKFMPNPCGEIILRPRGLCNLSTIVLREADDWDEVARKIRLAAILGTIQATFTDFRYISPEWKQNAEEERLIGVSMTGIMDCGLFVNALRNKDEVAANLERMREVVVKTNEEYASILGINPAAAATTIKPEGTSSQLTNSSSGIHPRYSKYYVRRVRINRDDPLFALAKDCGVPCTPEVGQSAQNATTWVLSFPTKAPETCVTRHDMTALNQLEMWLLFKRHWAEHSVSCTVYVDENEWFEVGNWVYTHWEDITGLSFLPKDNGVYELAPYEEITREEYEKITANEVSVDYWKLPRYEKTDMTMLEREWACSGDKCDLK